MKIMWHSNAPWAATGYGNQTGIFAPRIKGLGHEVAVCAFYGLHGAKLGWEDGISVYPGGADGYANDVYLSHAAHFFGETPDVGGLTISLVDAWILNPRTASRANHAVWAPVDHEDLPPGVEGFFKQSGSWAIAMSQSGQEAFARKDIPADYVPHGIDTSLYKPENRKDCRKALGIEEDLFVIGMVAANKGEPSRKAFAETLLAFKRLREKHDDAVMYMHTDPYGVNQGVDIPQLIDAIGFEHEAFRWVDAYQYNGLSCPPQHMVAAYNAMDVLVNPAYGEGFGIPVIEAQACGTPVIVQDFTAMAEVGKVGWQVGGQKFWTQQRAFQRIPNVDEIYEAMEDAYENAGKKRKSAREHAEGYDADLVTETYWKPLLEKAEGKLAAKRAEASGLEVVEKPKIDVLAA